MTLCPAEPLEGLKDEITGGPLGAMATVVVVVVEVELEAEVGVVAEDGFGGEVAVRLRAPVRDPVDGDRKSNV